MTRRLFESEVRKPKGLVSRTNCPACGKPMILVEYPPDGLDPNGSLRFRCPAAGCPLSDEVVESTACPVE